MEQKNRQLNLNETIENVGKTLFFTLIAIVSFSGILVFLIAKKDHYFLKRFTESTKKLFLIDSIITAIVAIPLLVALGASVHALFFVGIYLPICYLIFALSLYFVPIWFKDKFSFKINSSYLKRNIRVFKDFEQLIHSEEKSPIGKSLTTYESVFIQNSNRNEHIMITGSSGSGKSATAITMKRYDYLKGRAVVDIDPKGSSEDIGIVQKYAELSGRKDDFYIFNISDPLNSWGYNPLEIGTKRSKIDKIIYALELNHEHYSGIAIDVLAMLFDTAELLNQELNISKLARLLISKEELFTFFEQLHELEKSEERDDLLLRITSSKGLKNEDIKGIKSKVSSLAAFDLKPILNPKTEKKINLIEVIEKRKIAYFQLNTMEYKGLNKILSRFILSDLQIAASKISSGEIDIKKDFVAVYVDEAASFIDNTFPEYLRMVRDAKISLTFIFQSMASLDSLFGESFKHELISNTKYSLHFESAASPDAETITLIPGTIKSMQRSFAIDSSQVNNYSGRGTEFIGEEKKIETNILRSLKKGQCLFFDKARNYYDVIQIWHGKAALNDAISIENADISITNSKSNRLNISKKLTQKERLLMGVHPSQWHHLTYNEIEQIKLIRNSIS